jgi:hypothetical protein
MIRFFVEVRVAYLKKNVVCIVLLCVFTFRVLLCVFTFLVPCCDVRLHFRKEKDVLFVTWALTKEFKQSNYANIASINNNSRVNEDHSSIEAHEWIITVGRSRVTFIVIIERAQSYNSIHFWNLVMVIDFTNINNTNNNLTLTTSIHCPC